MLVTSCIRRPSRVHIGSSCTHQLCRSTISQHLHIINLLLPPDPPHLNTRAQSTSLPLPGSTGQQEHLTPNMPRSQASYMPSTEVFRNIPFPNVQYMHPNGSTCQFTDVPYRHKFALQKLEVKEWKQFNKEAAKIWTGKNEKQIDNETVTLLKVCANITRLERPKGEERLRSKFDANVLRPLDMMTDPSTEWEFGRPEKLGCESHSRIPDICSVRTNAGSSSSQTRDNTGRAMVCGEMKVPSCLKLDSSEVTAAWLQRQFRDSNFLRDNSLNPYFQALSYGLYTSKGLAFLTNYGVTRFFKINIGSNEMLMSPPVRIDQVLRKERDIPHAAQAMIYMIEMEDPNAKEFSTALANKLLEYGDKKADEHEKKEQEKEDKAKKEREDRAKKSSKGSSSKHTGSSSSGKKGKKHAETGSWEIFTPVSRVLQRCKVIGTVGEGVTGELSECDYDGLKVVVKVGQKMSYSDERDCFFHVKREAIMYKVLEKLQGRVIPRMVIGGLERYFTPSAMVLITEKVGMCVEQCNDGKILVDGRVLDEENLMLLQEKGLEGIKTMHEHSVVHYDTAARNTRVEMRGGKIERVWWVDLGDACEIDEEAKIVHDVQRGDYAKGIAIDLDVGVFEGSIQKALEATES